MRRDCPRVSRITGLLPSLSSLGQFDQAAASIFVESVQWLDEQKRDTGRIVFGIVIDRNPGLVLPAVAFEIRADLPMPVMPVPAL
jgi:hypothetical protein